MHHTRFDPRTRQLADRGGDGHHRRESRAGDAHEFTTIQRAIRTLFETGQFDEVAVECLLLDEPAAKTVYLIRVKERPILDNVDVAGPKAISLNSVRDKVDLLIGRPLSPANVAGNIARIDSVYRAQGYWGMQVRPETTTTAPDHVSILFRVDEGRKLAVSGVRVDGSSAVPAKEIVKQLQVKPEGLFFWQKGSSTPTSMPRTWASVSRSCTPIAGTSIFRSSATRSSWTVSVAKG